MDGKIPKHCRILHFISYRSLSKLPKILCRTGINGDHYLNYIAATPEPYFISATNTKAHVVDAEYTANDLIKIIEQLGAPKVVAVVMDNASTCVAAGNLIVQR